MENTKFFRNLHIPAAITTLDNGLTVASCQIKSALTEVWRTVAAGSMDDGEHPGTAHFVEHILFEGPTRDSVHPIMRPLARKAIDANAYTSHENTCYQLNNGEDVAEQIEAVLGMTRQIVAPQNVMDAERQVILQEIAENEVADRATLWKMKTAFPHISGLHHMMSGINESVEAITLDNLKNYHQRWYGPSNSLILVASQLPHQAVVDLVEKSPLSKAQKSESLRPRQAIYPHCVNGEYHSTHEPDEVTIYTPLLDSISQQDRIRIGIIADLLADSSFGLLWVKLRTNLGVVYGVEADLDEWRGLFYCSANTQPSNMQLVEEEYYVALDKIVQGAYSQELFESVIHRHYKQFIREKERVVLDGCLSDLEDIWLSGNNEDVDAMEVVRQTTRESLSKIALKCLFYKPHGCLYVIQDEE